MPYRESNPLIQLWTRTTPRIRRAFPTSTMITFREGVEPPTTRIRSAVLCPLSYRKRKWKWVESNHLRGTLQAPALPLSYTTDTKHVPQDSNPDQVGWNHRCYHYTKDIGTY